MFSIKAGKSDYPASLEKMCGRSWSFLVCGFFICSSAGKARRPMHVLVHPALGSSQASALMQRAVVQGLSQRLGH
jgi:hypothetical protein